MVKSTLLQTLCSLATILTVSQTALGESLNLKDLGQTVEELFDPDSPLSTAGHPLMLPPPPVCRDVTSAQIQGFYKEFDTATNTGAAIGRQNYLNSLGSKPCVVEGSYSVTAMCTGPYDGISVLIRGMPANGMQRAGNSLTGVVRGATWALQDCPNNLWKQSQWVGGFNAAYGNGNFIVYVVS